MRRTTVSITDEQGELLDKSTADDGPYESVSEAVREFIHQYERAAKLEQANERIKQERIGEYEDRIADLERENERLQREHRQLLEQREEHQELVRHVEDERKERDHRREHRNAPVWRRAKWWMFGRSDDTADS
jgi:Arc/MetJ-type ribon-helix-helix transcriptional regulator